MYPPLKKRVAFNIRGVIFETYPRTLRRFPDTLLGNEKKRSLYYCSKRKYHFLNRNPNCFEAILYFYQSNGTLYCPLGIPVTLFEEECKHFEIPQSVVKKLKRREGILSDLDDEHFVTEDRHFRSRVRTFLEEPRTSLASWVFGMFYLATIWLSIATCIVETIPAYHKHSHMWDMIELALNAWFAGELILRTVCLKDTFEFLLNLMNLVDIGAVVSYFLVLIVKTKRHGFIDIFRTLRFLRVFRLFRLSKHSRRLKVVGRILQLSLGNFRTLMLSVTILIILGASFIYLLEKDTNESLFTSVIASLWWAVITITSVGYGDITPVTAAGKLFASCFMMLGALTMSLPVLTIVLEFTELYPKNIECEEYLQQRKNGEAMQVKVKRPNVVGLYKNYNMSHLTNN